MALLPCQRPICFRCSAPIVINCFNVNLKHLQDWKTYLQVMQDEKMQDAFRMDYCAVIVFSTSSVWKCFCWKFAIYILCQCIKIFKFQNFKAICSFFWNSVTSFCELSCLVNWRVVIVVRITHNLKSNLVVFFVTHYFYDHCCRGILW